MMAHVFHDGMMNLCDDIIVGDLTTRDFQHICNGEQMIGLRRTLRANRNFPIRAGCRSMSRDNAM